jgi:hypothetical protein
VILRPTQYKIGRATARPLSPNPTEGKTSAPESS